MGLCCFRPKETDSKYTTAALHGVLVQENDLLFYKLLDFVRIRIVDDFEALLLLS